MLHLLTSRSLIHGSPAALTETMFTKAEEQPTCCWAHPPEPLPHTQQGLDAGQGMGISVQTGMCVCRL